MNKAALVLKDLLAKGVFDPSVHLWVSHLRDKTHAFEEGQRARIQKWVDDNHLEEFSKCLKPIAESIVALAEVDETGESVFLVDDVEKFNYPIDLQLRSAYKNYKDQGVDLNVIVALNPFVANLSTNTPGANIWMKNVGTLDLLAIVISYSEGFNQTLKFELVFGLPSGYKEKCLPDNEKILDGYVILGIDNDGEVHCQVHAIRAKIFIKGLSPSFVFAIGINEEKFIAIDSWRLGVSVKEGLGFPGARDYLAKHIFSLPEYLGAAADKRLDSKKS